jgi:hypothetical protein
VVNLVQSAFNLEVAANQYRVKFYCDFGILIEEELGDDTIRYTYDAPMDKNTEQTVPIIIKDSDNNESLDKYKLLVKDAILSFQEKALQSTKHKIVAIYSMMIVSYRLPAPASKSAEWIRKHLKLGITRNVDGLNCLCFFDSCSFDFYPDALETRIKDNTRASLAKVDFLNFMNAENKSTQHNPLINKYRGFDLDDIPKHGEYKNVPYSYILMIKTLTDIQ